MPLAGGKSYTFLNKSAPRLDGLAKVTGKALYAGDMNLPGMLHAATLHSPHAHADVLSVDIAEALALPGVVDILTCENAPLTQSWADYYYFTKCVRYVGDVVAMVAAETPQIARAALTLIRVEYKELPSIYSIEDALAANAPHTRTKGVGLNSAGIPDKSIPGNVFYDSYFPMRKGDVEKGFAEADLIVEGVYRTPMIEHAYIEPEACVVHQNPVDNLYTAYASCQNPFFTRRYLAEATQQPVGSVRAIQSVVGGSFGGKEELVGLMVGRAAMLCKRTGRPVKLVASREDSFRESSKRHPFRCTYKMGVKKNGTITALEGQQIDNCGAYNNQTQFLNGRAAIHSAGVYHIPHVKTDTFGVFTNNVHGGAMRGYSSPQLLFCQEQLMNDAARKLGMSPLEFRRKNLLKQGDLTATSQLLDQETITHEMLDFMVERYKFAETFAAYEKQGNTPKRRGIGLCTSFRGCGLGSESVDASGAMIHVTEDGSFILNCGLVDNGQGLKTAFAQIAAEGLGFGTEHMTFIGVDTSTVPDGGMTVASRGTTMAAQAMRRAGIKLGDILREHAARNLGCELADLGIEGVEYFVKSDPAKRLLLKHLCSERLWTGKQMTVFDWYSPPDLSQSKNIHTTGQGDAFPTYAYTVCIAEVEVDMETGMVDVLRVGSAHDLGTVVNPGTSKGQIFGGILMGQGFALSEEVEVENGKLHCMNLDEYIIPTSLDMPQMEAHLFESNDPAGTYGAKSLGEPATEAVGAAIAGAMSQALGRIPTRLPINLERVVLGKALRGREDV